jgi:hypothetical protein
MWFGYSRCTHFRASAAKRPATSLVRTAAPGAGAGGGTGPPIAAWAPGPSDRRNAMAASGGAARPERSSNIRQLSHYMASVAARAALRGAGRSPGRWLSQRPRPLRVRALPACTHRQHRSGAPLTSRYGDSPSAARLRPRTDVRPRYVARVFGSGAGCSVPAFHGSKRVNLSGSRNTTLQPWHA